MFFAKKGAKTDELIAAIKTNFCRLMAENQPVMENAKWFRSYAGKVLRELHELTRIAGNTDRSGWREVNFKPCFYFRVAQCLVTMRHFLLRTTFFCVVNIA